MITCDDTDLFGGRISIIASVEFCCQVETPGERLQIAPTTSFHDLIQLNGAGRVQPVIALLHDSKWIGEGSLARHKMMVDFLERLAEEGSRISLRTALEMASNEFSYLGDWKWPAGVHSEFEAPRPRVVNRLSAEGNYHGGEFHSLAQLREIRRTPAFIPPFGDFQGHADSPLAE